MSLSFKVSLRHNILNTQKKNIIVSFRKRPCGVPLCMLLHQEVIQFFWHVDIMNDLAVTTLHIRLRKFCAVLWIITYASGSVVDISDVVWSWRFWCHCYYEAKMFIITPARDWTLSWSPLPKASRIFSVQRCPILATSGVCFQNNSTPLGFLTLDEQ
jgi:hypothetical protein